MHTQTLVQEAHRGVNFCLMFRQARWVWVRERYLIKKKMTMENHRYSTYLSDPLKFLKPAHVIQITTTSCRTSASLDIWDTYKTTPRYGKAIHSEVIWSGTLFPRCPPSPLHLDEKTRFPWYSVNQNGIWWMIFIFEGALIPLHSTGDLNVQKLWLFFSSFDHYYGSISTACGKAQFTFSAFSDFLLIPLQVRR